MKSEGFRDDAPSAISDYPGVQAGWDDALQSGPLKGSVLAHVAVQQDARMQTASVEPSLHNKQMHWKCHVNSRLVSCCTWSFDTIGSSSSTLHASSQWNKSLSHDLLP